MEWHDTFGFIWYGVSVAVLMASIICLALTFISPHTAALCGMMVAVVGFVPFGVTSYYYASRREK